MTDDPGIAALAAGLVRAHVGHPVAIHESPQQYDSLSGEDCRMPNCYAAALAATPPVAALLRKAAAFDTLEAEREAAVAYLSESLAKVAAERDEALRLAAIGRAVDGLGGRFTIDRSPSRHPHSAFRVVIDNPQGGWRDGFGPTLDAAIAAATGGTE